MEEVDINLARAVVDLPVNAVEVEISAKIYMDGKLQDVVSTMDMDGIRKAIDDGKNVFLDDDVFVLTEKGKNELGR